MTDGFVYYRHLDGRAFRVDIDFWRSDEKFLQEVWNHTLRMWLPADDSFERLVQNEEVVYLAEGNPYQEFETANYRFGASLPKSLVELCQVLPDLRNGAKFKTACYMFEIKESLSLVLENLRMNSRNWSVAILVHDDPQCSLHVFTDEEHNIWAALWRSEFIFEEGEFITIENCFSEEEEELLPLLGWQWPKPPNVDHWYCRDEFLNAGYAMASLVIQTLRELFQCNDDRVLHFSIVPEE